MLYTHNNFAKDPAVVNFGGRYIMYHSTTDPEDRRLLIGIAESDDMENWRFNSLYPTDDGCEKNGVGAPSAIVLDGKVHLFYQSYGNQLLDAICHAVSEDGIHFTKDPTNPIFRPSKSWCCGRAIDADIAVMNGRLYLYFATRDHAYKIQKLGVASADINSAFSREDFREEKEGAILEPTLPWEQQCIEAPASLVKDGKMYLFYAGAYNCKPQRIGLAVSDDGVNFTRVSDEAFYKEGPAGAWNSSESGHPYVFEDNDGKVYLFYQGSPDMGKTWILSRLELTYENGKFSVAKVCDKA